MILNWDEKGNERKWNWTDTFDEQQMHLLDDLQNNL